MNIDDQQLSGMREGRMIHVIMRNMRTELDARFAELGLTAGMLFLPMRHFDGCNQEKIASFMQLDKGAVARSVKKMEDGGFVRREKDPEDGRAYCVYLTEKSKALFPQVDTILDDIHREFFGNALDEEERLIFKRLLLKVTANVLGEERFDCFMGHYHEK